jgi:hypothetical protein
LRPGQKRGPAPKVSDFEAASLSLLSHRSGSNSSGLPSRCLSASRSKINSRVPAGMCVSQIVVSTNGSSVNSGPGRLHPQRLANHRFAVLQSGDLLVLTRERSFAKHGIGLFGEPPLSTRTRTQRHVASFLCGAALVALVSEDYEEASVRPSAPSNTSIERAHWRESGPR